MSKQRKYTPRTKLNPIVQAKKIDDLSLEIISLGKAIQAISKSHDIHISYLANFARHDIKNSIQSMDSILSTNSPAEINDEHIFSLKTNLKVIRETMDNFSKLVPYSQDEKFSLRNLIVAIELLNRHTFHSKRIEFLKDIPQDVEIVMSLPFQSILQMLNNLIINSVKSLENISLPKIKLSAIISDEVFYIEVSDNGKDIDSDLLEQVFEFGYSTTGGSGIGLFHAKYLCELLSGKIELIKEEGEFSKSFRIYLPIINE